MSTTYTLNNEQENHLIELLKKRFEENISRHPEINWKTVEEKLKNQPEKLWSINQMELTGGEPDVIILNEKLNTIYYIDCSIESPKDRRSFAYDLVGQTSRKEHQPKNNAIDSAKQMKIELLDEQDYRNLQKIITVDQKTSSWLKTPESIRELGGAIFGDYRYETVFIYHNGAQSYYAARGFRGKIEL